MKDKILFSLIFFLVLLALWQVIFSIGFYNHLIIPSPFETLLRVTDIFTSTSYLPDVLASTFRVFVAFILSSLVGVSLGLLFGYFSILDQLTEVFIDFFRSIPAITLFPLLILLFGISDVSRIIVAILIGFPVVLISTKYGVINSNQKRVKMGRLYKLSNFEILKRITLPESSPYIFNGLRVSLSLIIILVIVTEMLVGTDNGLGSILIDSQYSFDTDIMYAVIISLGIIGFLLNQCFVFIERKFFHWKQ